MTLLARSGPDAGLMPSIPLQLRFGRKPEKTDPMFRTLRFENYANRSVLPAPADKWRISKTPSSWPMYLNNQLGCCTFAMIAHFLQAWSLDTDQAQFNVTDNDVLNAYMAVGNQEHPNQPNTDQGCYLLDVYNYMRKIGMAGKKILAFVKVLPMDVQLAAGLFDGVGVGFQCQQNVITDFNNHQPWTPGTLTQEGHAVPIIEYDSTYLKMVSWAAEQEGTYAWAQECVDEYWVAVPDDFEKKVPSGFDLEHLWADLGQVSTPDSPQPGPFTPTPVPQPTPSNWYNRLPTQDELNKVILQVMGPIQEIDLKFAKGAVWPEVIVAPPGDIVSQSFARAVNAGYNA
jgi:hypothetical protein